MTRDNLQEQPQPISETEDPVLAEIVRRLVDVYRPQRIYLFGSGARGDSNTDSDYDLMVLVANGTPPDRQCSSLAYESFWGLKASTDVLVWTEEAFDQRLHLKASLPSTVVREGRLLHAA